MKYLHVLSLCCISVLITGGCGDDPGSEITVLQDVDLLELSVSVSIGSEFGDSSQVFGSIADVCHDAGGNILVLDQVERGVKVFDVNGRYLCQMGRGGEGPGEMQMPLYVVSLNDGRSFIHDPMNNAFLAFDSTYSYQENISLWDNGPPIQPVAVAQSDFAGILIGFDMEQDQPMITRTIGRYGGEREPGTVYYSDEVPFDFSDFTSVLTSMLFSFSITGDRSGRFFYSPISSESYEVIAFDSGGIPLFHITLDIPAVLKSEREMEDEILYIESWANRIGMQGVVIEWEPDPYRTFVKGLGVDHLDRLWVVRGTELQPVFDVFDMTGSHLFSARLPVESSSWRFHIDSWGILGWEEDPEAGFQQLHLIEFPEDQVE